MMFNMAAANPALDFTASRLWQPAQGLPAKVFAGQSFALIEDPPAVDNAPYLDFNLGLHVGDAVQAVQSRRMQLLSALQPFGAKRLAWLNQTHSCTAHQLGAALQPELQVGDGLITQQPGVVLMMMTADCLPIVLSNAEGSEVACVHAGWRGLANGVIEASVAKMHQPAAYAWIGTAISAAHFEVGPEVRAVFVDQDHDFINDFALHASGKYLADLYAIARKKLHKLGVGQVLCSRHCSYAEPQFYSYRRQAITGRMATFVFISCR
jgi:YfiH family protein